MHAINLRFLIVALGVTVVSVFLFFHFFSVTHAAVSCTFDRDLEEGVDGEDVRCLQKYLNEAGYTVAESGVGSPGNETSLFRTLTKEAVARWQEANGVSPASGYFGPLSRAKYESLTSGGVVAGAATSQSLQEAQLKALNDQLSKLQAEAALAKGASTVGKDEAEKELLKALQQLEDAEDQVDDALDDGMGIGDADDTIIDARENFYEAVAAYIGGDYQRAYDFARYTFDDAEDAYEDAGGVTEAEEVEEYIDEVDDEIDDAEDTIEDAEDDDKDVDEAEELLQKAKDALEAAEDALRDDEYDEAMDLAEDAEDFAEDAVDAIDDSKEEQAEDAIDDAQDAIDYAKEEIEEAEDDGEDVDEAEDLVDEAEDLLDDAQDEYDDEDYDDAIELAEEAEERAEDALDEI